ncbi:MAG TPA: alpha-hydroxy acid oxidase [Stellaceae bacterium]|nr:alpha-hydroxy acid oxidase [Stellaceae bacterium]
MPDSTPVTAPGPRVAEPSAAEAAARLALKRRFPTAADLRARAKHRLPNFAYEYGDGGAGGADTGIARNNHAFDAIEMIPRYGKVVSPPPADCSLFGRHYAAPIGVAPVGGPGTVYPGAETYLAKACQAAGVPYTLGLLSGIGVEEAARLAPDVLWFQLYRFARNEHAIGFDLVKRAAAGVHVLMLTIDTPIRTTRPREVKSGIVTPFRLTSRMKLDALTSPHWTRALMRNGIPKFVNLRPYMGADTGVAAGAAFMQREGGGAFTWDEVARYRDKWQKPLVVKGVLHPEDAEKAVALGLDGIVVSNHGGRQIDALPAPIDTLPAIAAAVGKRATVLYDSGVRSGVDVARAIALGADGCLAGKAFLWSLGALGEQGPAHMLGLFIDELRATLGQLGCPTVSDLRSVPVRHPGAYRAADFAARG